MQNSHDVAGSVLWKKSDIVPGRPVSSTQTLQLIRDSKSASPKKSLSKQKHHKNASTSSFQEFQDSTEDAWDVGDDDFFFSDVAIHSKVAESTAMKVLSNHSEGKLQFPKSEEKNVSKGDEKQSSLNDTTATSKSDKSKDQVFLPAKQRIGELRQGIRKQPSHQSFAPGKAIRQVHDAKSANSTGSKREIAKIESFHKLLQSENTDIKELRTLSWPGVPNSVRPIVWKLLAGYLPTALERRESFLLRKKEEYYSLIAQYYDSRNEDVHHETYRQIHIDIPRMSPLVPLFQQEIVQKAFERILYILAIRRPASGYVQGMNDLVTPFFVVFLQDHVAEGVDVEDFDVSVVPSEALKQVEADSYWCMTQLLDGIQDNYTFAQPGIQKKVHMLKELIQRIDPPLHRHLMNHSIEYLQFSFRWMNNLLMRELPLACTIRLWDTYLAEINGFSCFHLYVCAAFLTFWSERLLKEKDFQGLMLFLQNLPTLRWGNSEIGLLVAEAYKLKYTFDDAPNHLQPQENLSS